MIRVADRPNLAYLNNRYHDPTLGGRDLAAVAAVCVRASVTTPSAEAGYTYTSSWVDQMAGWPW